MAFVINCKHFWGVVFWEEGGEEGLVHTLNFSYQNVLYKYHGSFSKGNAKCCVGAVVVMVFNQQAFIIYCTWGKVLC